MKKILIAVLIVGLIAVSVEAQGPIYLPWIVSQNVVCGGDEMSDWKVIVPEATTNKVLNPSAETTGNFAAVGGGGAAMAQSSTYQRYGLYSYRIQTTGDNEGGSLTLSALANAIHYFTFRVRGTLPTAWDCSVDNANYTACTLIESLDSNWSLYGVQFPAAQCNGSTTLYIRQNGAGSGDFYVDGVQVEEKEYWTTYTDGDQEGCEWNGEAHASTSSRSASSRAGGRQKDLQTDYYFDIGGMVGLGTAPRSVIMDEYALLPGGELNTIKIHPRPFTLSGVVRGTSMSNLHTKLADLEAVLIPEAYPMDEDGYQPVRLRYTGSTVHKEIAALYEGGMEGNIQTKEPCYWQRMAIRFLAEDPNFYSYGGSGKGGAGEAMVLDSNDTMTSRYCAARLKSTGQWDDLGLTANPDAGGHVVCMTWGPDGQLYIGGTFDNMNNEDGMDYIACYNPQTDAWSIVGGAAALNDDVMAIKFHPNGDLYVGGRFTDAGAVGAADYIAYWDGAAWHAVGTPGEVALRAVYDFEWDSDGNLYVVGAFTDWAGVGADYIAMWDGAAWNMVGDPEQGAAAITYIQTIVIDEDDLITVGGPFTNLSDIADADYIAQYDGSSWAAISSDKLDNTVRKIIIATDKTLLVGGNFTESDSVTLNHIARWNGTAWEALGDGMSPAGGVVAALIIGPDDVVYAGGTFLTAGGLAVADYVAKWNGSSWAHLDINLPGTPEGSCFAIGGVDPVNPRIYDLYLGHTTTGTAYFAGSATVTNNGTSPVYPTIIIERSGGTAAVIESVRNETMGKELSFNYGLQDGERLTIDLRPTQQSIVSDVFGSRPDAILAGSDMGDFTLEPGDNNITCFVNVTDAPTVTAWIEWRMAYKGL